MIKAPRAIASALVALATLLAPATVFAGYFPTDPAVRPTYTCNAAGTICPGADHVQFDSFTNNPVVGDERPFLAGSLNGANVQDQITVKDGDTIVVRAYVHNNADATKMGGEANTVAHNVNFKLLVPTASQSTTQLVGFISASNASPASINDTMSLVGASNFTVAYVPGTAVFTHSPTGDVSKQVTDKLSDSVVTAAGASLGDINGCFAYSGYVTLSVKVTMPKTTTPVYTCNLLSVTKGDNRAVQASVAYSALNGATLSNVTYNFGDGAASVFTTNQTTKSYQYSKDGTYHITATLNFTVNGQPVNGVTSTSCAQDVTFSSTPGTPPPVTPPTELPNTGTGNVIGVVFGAIVAGTIAGRLFLSRKLSRR